MLQKLIRRFKIRKVSCVNNADRECPWLCSCKEFKKNKGVGIHSDPDAISRCCTASQQLNHLLHAATKK